MSFETSSVLFSRDVAKDRPTADLSQVHPWGAKHGWQVTVVQHKPPAQSLGCMRLVTSSWISLGSPLAARRFEISGYTT